MPVYDRSPPTDVTFIDQWDGGFGWLVHPDEAGQRASHAIECPDGLWLLDPLDGPGIDDAIAERGTVAGVAVLSGHHTRDAAAFAQRYGVSVWVPQWLDRAADTLDGVPVERYDSDLAETGFRVSHLHPLPGWHEGVAFREADGTLVVPDVLGSATGYATSVERVGVELSQRLVPPRDRFEDIEPERILFGHGVGVFEDASEGLSAALATARKRLPRALREHLGTQLRGLWESTR